MSKTLAQAVPPADPASQTLSLKTRIQDLPLSKQILLTSGFVFLMLLTLVIPDPVPFLDELLVGWLLFTGASATVGTLRQRRAERLEAGGGTLDVRAQQGSTDDAETEDALKQAAAAELEGLGTARVPPAAATATSPAGTTTAPRPAPRRIPLGDDTWKIFELLRKCRKLARSLQRDGFPDAGKEQLLGIERRVGELRQRFKELEQLLRTRELDLGLADREIKKLDRRLASAQGDMEKESVERSMAHAVHHREHVLSVMDARNRYVLRLQELYHHVRQLHSSMMVMNSPAQVEADELIEEIDALVASVEAVEVVRREVQSTLAGGAKAVAGDGAETGGASGSEAEPVGRTTESETETESESEAESEAEAEAEAESEAEAEPMCRTTESEAEMETYIQAAVDRELAALEEGAGSKTPGSEKAEERQPERDRPDPRVAAKREPQG